MILADTTNLILAGGSQPGLLLAGLAIADELRSLVPHARILFAGTETGDDCRQICRAGYEYVVLDPARASRALWGWRLPRTRWGEPQWLLNRTQPAAVVSLGGSLGESMGRAAVRLGLPLVLLEQRAAASRGTRRLAAKAQLLCQGFPFRNDAAWHVAGMIRDLISPGAKPCAA